MDVTPIAVAAAVWGAATGLLVPRAAYRLSVEPEEDWRSACPRGHALTGPAAGWLGLARCAPCAAGAPATPPDATPPDAPAAAGATASGTRPAGAQADAPARSVSEPVPARSVDEPAAAARADESARPSAPGALATAPPDPPGPDPAGPGQGAAPDAPDASDASAAPAEPPARPVPYRLSVPVAAVTAVVCLLLAYATGPRPELAVWLAAAPFAVLLALVDRNVHRLPDQLTLPLAGAAALLLGAAALAPGDGGSWPTALLGGLALGGVYFLLFLINPNGMGFGDVKLALSLGVVLGWYGWTVLFAGAFAGFLLGSVYGAGLMLLRRANRRTAIPFGPFMITGAFLGLLLGALAAS
ncbi:prepilin peptidase [Streptomyces zhihengii]|uniref:prepilin peptidase n=1 Tax=Streptomyces zhihengii TaxID=1818004 RepID=UPI0033BDF45A